LSAASSISPPRAQLTIRTPFLVLASARAKDVARLVGQRRVQGDEVGAREQLVELDLLDARAPARARASGRVVGDDLHRRPSARSATIEPMLPAPISPERLAGQLDAP
jgi:hypothetical protein